MILKRRERDENRGQEMKSFKRGEKHRGCTYCRKHYVAVVVEIAAGCVCLFSWAYGSSRFPSSSSSS